MNLIDAEPISFRGALYVDGTLEYIFGVTPYSRSFAAGQIIFTLESIHPDARIAAELFSDRHGPSMRVLGFAGGNGYIFEHRDGSAAGTGRGRRIG